MIAVASADIRKHLSTQVNALLGSSASHNALPGHLPGDSASQARVPLILERLHGASEGIPRMSVSRRSLPWIADGFPGLAH